MLCNIYFLSALLALRILDKHCLSIRDILEDLDKSIADFVKKELVITIPLSAR